MDQNPHIWRCWARNLQQWGLNGWITAFLEAAGPLTILAAQFIYFAQPVLNWIVAEDQLLTFADLLENQSNKDLFLEFLQEESTQ
jgi:hypothetical protein